MAQPAPVMPPLLEFRSKGTEEPELRFECMLLTEQGGETKARSATLMVSLAVHLVLTALVLLIPILTYNALPAPSETARAFFVAPPEAAPPPPPPPPPAEVRAVPRASAAPIPPPEEAKFVAPVEVPDTIKPEQNLDVALTGVAGGVEGGVPGGVIGGIVGGLPAPAPPPVRAVRVGGQIKAPKLVNVVQPVYPELAAQARLTAIVIAEALVDTSGRVREVKVLRGAPLFDEAAIEAVKQWRYLPLLLNGVPTEFILTITVKFNLSAAGK